MHIKIQKCISKNAYQFSARQEMHIRAACHRPNPAKCRSAQENPWLNPSPAGSWKHTLTYGGRKSKMHFGQMHVNIFKKYAFCNMHFSELEVFMSKNMHFAICIFQNWKYAKNRHFPRENAFFAYFSQNSWFQPKFWKICIFKPWKYAKNKHFTL